MTALSPTAAAPSPSTRWLADRYEFLDELGRGGSSVVFRARERATGRVVAVKLVEHAADEDGAAARAVREARVAAALQHRHIVETLAVEEGDGVTALVSAYVPGGTLRAALRAAAEAGTAWPYDRVVRVLRDVASALAHAHAHRVVHQDVKPENVLLDAPDAGAPGVRALLGDFGIARRIGPDALPTRTDAAGTPSYMAPEQIAGRPVDERTDVYALGLIGWEMLVGRRPWQGETLYTVLHKQQHEVLPALAPLRPDIPAFLLAAVEGALAKHPAGRWRDGAEFLRRLTPTPTQLPPIVAPPDADLAGATVRFAAPPAGRRAVDGPGRGARARPAPRLVTPGRVTVTVAVVAAAAALWTARPGRPDAVTRQADGMLASAAALAERSVAAPASAGGHESAGRAEGDRAAAGRAREDHAPDARRPRRSGRAPRAAGTFAPGQLRTSGTAPAPAGTRAAAGRRPGATGPRVAAVAGAAPGGASPVRGSTARPAAPARAPMRTPAPAAAPTAARAGAPPAPSADVARQLRAADARLAASYGALIAAMRQSAGGGWEPRAVRALRDEQRRWLARRDADCGGASGGAAADAAGCRVAATNRRAGELAARRARFAVDATP